jgi:hypothetical protein
MLIVWQTHVCVFGRGVNPAGYNRETGLVPSWK